MRGTIHCYTGTKFIPVFRVRFYIGFTGIITFTSAKAVRASVRRYPGRLLLKPSTLFGPVPHRGQRNEPAYVQYVAQEIAQLKYLSLEQVAKQTTMNAVELFAILYTGSMQILTWLIPSVVVIVCASVLWRWLDQNCKNRWFRSPWHAEQNIRGCILGWIMLLAWLRLSIRN